jgi:uncharacterized protein (TIGR02646 family)
LIRVQRTPEPPVLRKNAARWLSNLTAVRAQPNPTKQQIAQAQNKYSHRAVKQALVVMFNGKCAYCESKITVVTYGSIEHFCPKHRFIGLTFVWENLLLSCDVCNDAGHKGTNFPLDQNGQPLLIDPTDGVSDPSLHLKFDWDPVAGLASVYGLDDRGMAVEQIFDLNGTGGRRDLIEQRSKYVKHLIFLLPLAKQGDLEVIALLREATLPNAEYSAFARIYVLPHLP